MRELGKSYEFEIYDGAGHAFFRQQDGQQGANLAAARKGWPRMVEFLKRELGSTASLSLGASKLASYRESTEVSVACACEGD